MTDDLRALSWAELAEKLEKFESGGCEFVICQQERECAWEAARRLRATCAWTEDPDTGRWDTACGRSWEFVNDGPTENRMDYCMGCGCRVDVRADAGERGRDDG